MTRAASPRIIVFGNEKGGSGKSTAAVQVAIGLLRRGHAVATLDLDARQGTLSRYMTNREARGGLPMPSHVSLGQSGLDTGAEALAADRAAFEAALAALNGAEFVVIDTPGSDTRLSRLAHARADTLVTPINDNRPPEDVGLGTSNTTTTPGMTRSAPGPLAQLTRASG